MSIAPRHQDKGLAASLSHSQTNCWPPKEAEIQVAMSPRGSPYAPRGLIPVERKYPGLPKSSLLAGHHSQIHHSRPPHKHAVRAHTHTAHADCTLDQHFWQQNLSQLVLMLEDMHWEVKHWEVRFSHEAAQPTRLWTYPLCPEEKREKSHQGPVCEGLKVQWGEKEEEMVQRWSVHAHLPWSP